MVEDLVLEVVENSRRLATDSFGSESLTKHTPSAEKRYRCCEINPCLSLLPQFAQFCVVYWLRIFHDISSFENEAKQRECDSTEKMKK